MQTLYFNKDQTRELLGISDFALTLMQHYVAIGHQTNPVMEDSTMAALLEQSEKKIKNTRLALTKAGWFKRVKTTVKGETLIIYQVGKDAVNQSTIANLSPSQRTKRTEWLKERGYESLTEFKAKASPEQLRELLDTFK